MCVLECECVRVCMLVCVCVRVWCGVEIVVFGLGDLGLNFWFLI